MIQNGLRNSEKTKLPIRLKMAALLVIARLTWGEFLSPIYMKNYFVKFFPPPRISVYRQSLYQYFFWFRN